MTSPLWTAQRHGQDWEDPDCLAAIAWLTQGLPARTWSNRMEAVQATFEAAKVKWAQGERVSLFDSADAAAWYVFQAKAYAADREHWFEPEAYRIVPLFRRIGQLLPELKQVEGADDRVVEMMTRYRRQPDDGIYELLVRACGTRRKATPRPVRLPGAAKLGGGVQAGGAIRIR